MQPIKTCTFPEPYTSSHYEKVLMYMYMYIIFYGYITYRYLHVQAVTAPVLGSSVLVWVCTNVAAAIQNSLPQSLWNQVAPGTLWNMRNSSSALVSLCVHGVDLDAELPLLALDSSSGSGEKLSLFRELY